MWKDTSGRTKCLVRRGQKHLGVEVMIRARGKGYMVGPNYLPSCSLVVVVGRFGQLQPWDFEDGTAFGCMVSHPQGAAVSGRGTTWLADAHLGAIPPYVVACIGFACSAALLYPLHYLWIGRNVPCCTDGVRHQWGHWTHDELRARRIVCHHIFNKCKTAYSSREYAT